MSSTEKDDGSPVDVFADVPDTKISTIYTTVQHMTPEAAGALQESTRNQFAIPAEQRTAQEKQETIRYALRTCAVLAIAGTLLWILYAAITSEVSDGVLFGLITAIAVVGAALGVDLPEVLKRFASTPDTSQE